MVLVTMLDWGKGKKKQLFTMDFLFGSVYAPDKRPISGFIVTSLR